MLSLISWLRQMRQGSSYRVSNHGECASTGQNFKCEIDWQPNPNHGLENARAVSLWVLVDDLSGVLLRPTESRITQKRQAGMRTEISSRNLKFINRVEVYESLRDFESGKILQKSPYYPEPGIDHSRVTTMYLRIVSGQLATRTVAA